MSGGGRGKLLLEELKKKNAIKAAEDAAEKRDAAGCPLPGDEVLMESVRLRRQREAGAPALTAKFKSDYEAAARAGTNVPIVTPGRSMGRGSLSSPHTPTTTTTVTAPGASGSPRHQSSVQSVASMSTFATTGAIPKGRGIGLRGPAAAAARPSVSKVPDVGSLRIGSSSPAQYPGSPIRGPPSIASGAPSSIPPSPSRPRSVHPSPIPTRPTSPARGGGYTEEEILSVIVEPMLYHLLEPYGSHGKVVEIVSNFIKLSFYPGKGIYEYVVDFEPIVDHRNERHRLIKQLADVIGKTQTFDGNKLYLPFQLTDQITELMSTSSSTGENVKVRIRFLRSKQIEDPDCTYLFNVLFRKIMSAALNFAQINRDFYDPMSAAPIPRHNLEVWPGFVTSVNDYDGGVHLQLDVSHRILRKETAYDVLAAIRKRPGANFQVDAQKALIGRIVLTRYNNRSYKVDDLDFDRRPNDTFTLSDGTDISFVDYFKKKYNISIRDPNQPMIVNRPKAKTAHEEATTRLIVLVPEQCYLTGLTDAMKADFNIMKDVAVHTRVSPADRQKSVTQFLTRIRECPKAMEILNDWGLKIAMEAEPIQGRVMNAEVLTFGGNFQERVNPTTADFSRTACSKPMLVPKALTNWLLVYLDKNELVVRGFFNTLQQEGRKMGMTIAIPGLIKLDNDRTETYLKQIRAKVKTGETQLIVTVVPAQRSDRYSALKKYCYVESPVPSQVIVTKTISNQQKLTSVVQKIALQINCKLGGELWSTGCPFQDVMIIGVDVYHDITSSSTGRKSIAGFVASTNSGFSRWYSLVAVQGHKQELVDELQACFVKALRAYYDQNHCFPKTILLFRDGVGEGQLETVITHECTQLMQCFNQIQVGYKPAFAFLVVMKRINVRLFSRIGGSLCNPAPGTVVDRVITRSKKQRKLMYDFFLVSQKVGQGTVTPTRIVVVKDHPTLTPETLQKFSYKMTHMYYNWPGTIRVPAPCQYAHKLANMVGENLHQPPSEALSRTLFYL